MTLKWKDLEFSPKYKECKVKLNNDTYVLTYYNNGGINDIVLISDGDKVVIILENIICDIKFFNNLKLELIKN